MAVDNAGRRRQQGRDAIDGGLEPAGLRRVQPLQIVNPIAASSGSDLFETGYFRLAGGGGYYGGGQYVGVGGRACARVYDVVPPFAALLPTAVIAPGGGYAAGAYRQQFKLGILREYRNSRSVNSYEPLVVLSRRASNGSAGSRNVTSCATAARITSALNATSTRQHRRPRPARQPHLGRHRT